MREMFLRAILTVDETMNMVTMILSIVEYWQLLQNLEFVHEEIKRAGL